MITREEVLEVLSYDPMTGIFIRINPPPQLIGKPVGYYNKDSYLCIRIKRRDYKAHRLAWLIVYGEWPTQNIDHKDNNPKNNSIHNLRECNQTQNGGNCGMRITNKSGYKGVSWSKTHKKWRAQIRHNGKARNLGSFRTPEEAHYAYVVAAIEVHGEFART